jgi:hypothetical protein
VIVFDFLIVCLNRQQLNSEEESGGRDKNLKKTKDAAVKMGGVGTKAQAILQMLTRKPPSKSR